MLLLMINAIITKIVDKNIQLLQTISEILGHASSNSTKAYLQVDINGLRKCAINPDEVYDNETI